MIGWWTAYGRKFEKQATNNNWNVYGLNNNKNISKKTISKSISRIDDELKGNLKETHLSIYIVFFLYKQMVFLNLKKTQVLKNGKFPESTWKTKVIKWVLLVSLLCTEHTTLLLYKNTYQKLHNNNINNDI